MDNYRHISALLLAAGLGTRLSPLTNIWPKCLMPINGVPLLEYWFTLLKKVPVDEIIVNTHYKPKLVKEFVSRPRFGSAIRTVYEPELLGTAGTLRNIAPSLKNKTCLLIHADNFCCCNFEKFIDYHFYERPKNTVMTMMTFKSPTPSSCGIIECDSKGVVKGYHEKVKNPPGNLANAAIYLLEKNVIDWVENNVGINDFSTEVIPNYIGQIATWENEEIHKDIGTISMLRAAQKDNCEIFFDEPDDWQLSFLKNPVHTMIENADD